MQGLRQLGILGRPQASHITRTRSYTLQHGHQHTPLHPPKRTKLKPSVAIATVAASVSFYTIGSLYPPQIATIISPRAAPGPPDPNLPSSIAYAAELESKLQALPYLTTLRSAKDADDWYETRPYVNFPEERRVNSLTAGTLRGPGKLALPPLVRAKRDESECIVLTHVGRGLCGHDGIIHGGLLATISDEALARTAIMNLPEKIAVTANLSIEYKAPTRADQFIVIRTKVDEKKGRRVSVSARIEDLSGQLLVVVRGTFVQPKYAKLLDSAGIRKIIGEPPDAPILPGSNVPVPAIPPDVGLNPGAPQTPEKGEKL